jgi:multidrug resistance efflux pump
MQNGGSEYQSIAAQYAAAKAQQDTDRQKELEKKKTAYLNKLQEARFTVTHGLLVTFLTLVLYVYVRFWSGEGAIG